MIHILLESLLFGSQAHHTKKEQKQCKVELYGELTRNTMVELVEPLYYCLARQYSNWLPLFTEVRQTCHSPPSQTITTTKHYCVPKHPFTGTPHNSNITIGSGD